MIDIAEFNGDLVLVDTNVGKAQNVLSIQLGSLYYAEDFGIDLAYFLSEEFEFTNDSFRSLLVAAFD